MKIGEASPSKEDYLKAIYQIAEDSDAVTTHALAGRLSVSAGAISKMLRHLAELRLVNHVPYRSVELTEVGNKMALEIIRHHRLLERYLVEALGYDWGEVHAEADRMEHHISEEFESRIDALLQHPETCPHGDPIPTRDGGVAPVSRRTLAIQTGPEALHVQRVRDEDAGLLSYCKSVGLVPGAAIAFVEREPFGGAFVVEIGGNTVRVPPDAAGQVYVAPAVNDAGRATETVKAMTMTGAAS